MDTIAFKWNEAVKQPEEWDEPVLCCTEKEKLCVFKDTKGSYKDNGKIVYYSNWNRIKNDYKVKYWIYQRDIIQK